MTADVRLRRMAPLAQVTMRADPTDGALMARLGAALATALTTSPNTVAEATEGQLQVLWLGPDEWLVIGPEGAGPEVAPALEAAIRVAAEEIKHGINQTISKNIARANERLAAVETDVPPPVNA